MHVIVLLMILSFWGSTEKTPVAGARAFASAEECQAAAPELKALALAADTEVKEVHWQCLDADLPEQDED